MKDYKEIRPDYTVDKFVDGQAPTANDNSFQQMVNFIPGRGQIRSRLGIGELVHTPDTTGLAWNPEDYSPGDPVYIDEVPDGDYAVIQAIFPFNSTASLGYNVLNNALIYSAQQSVATESGHATSSPTYKQEGYGGYLVHDNTAINTYAGNPARYHTMRVAPPLYPSWMPGYAGVKKFFMTYWIYPFRADPSANAEWHFCFGNNNFAYSTMLRHFDTNLQYGAFNEEHGNSEFNVQISNCMVPNTWNFIAAWSNNNLDHVGLYHWDETNKSEQMILPVEGAKSGHQYKLYTTSVFNAHVSWNATSQSYLPDASDRCACSYDYVTMWSRPMQLNNSSNVTLARVIRNLHATL